MPIEAGIGTDAAIPSPPATTTAGMGKDTDLPRLPQEAHRPLHGRPPAGTRVPHQYLFPHPSTSESVPVMGKVTTTAHGLHGRTHTDPLAQAHNDPDVFCSSPPGADPEMGKDTITAFASTSSFGYTPQRISLGSVFSSSVVVSEGTEFETDLSGEGGNDTSLGRSSAIAPSSIPSAPQPRSSWGRPRAACLPTSTIRLGSWNVEGMRGDSQVKFTEIFGTM